MVPPSNKIIKCYMLEVADDLDDDENDGCINHIQILHRRRSKRKKNLHYKANTKQKNQIRNNLTDLTQNMFDVTII